MKRCLKTFFNIELISNNKNENKRLKKKEKQEELFQKRLAEMNLVPVVQEKNINTVMVLKCSEVIFKYFFFLFFTSFSIGILFKFQNF